MSHCARHFALKVEYLNTFSFLLVGHILVKNLISNVKYFYKFGLKCLTFVSL